MANGTRSADIELVGYGTGAATLKEVEKAIQASWKAVQTDAALRAKVAHALELPENAVAQLPEPPLRLQPVQAGAGMVDIAVMIVTYIGTDIVWAAFRDLAKEELKRRLKQVWNLLEPEVTAELRDRNALGPRKDIES